MHLLCKSGELRHYRVGVAIRVMPDWVEEYRRANTSGPTPAPTVGVAEVDW